MTREEAFAEATAEQWAAADAGDPAARGPAASGGCASGATRSGTADGPVTLVDAGIGPAGSLAAGWAPVPGHLPEELAAAGIDPADVTAIVLTHLHNDHIGWAVPAAGTRRSPTPGWWCSGPTSTRTRRRRDTAASPTC